MSEKKEAIRLVEEEKYSHEAAARHVGAPQSCVTRWIAQKEDILAADDKAMILHPGRMVEHEETEVFVHSEFLKLREKGLRITYLILIGLAAQHDPSFLKNSAAYNHSWCQRFCGR